MGGSRHGTKTASHAMQSRLSGVSLVSSPILIEIGL